MIVVHCRYKLLLANQTYRDVLFVIRFSFLFSFLTSQLRYADLHIHYLNSNSCCTSNPYIPYAEPRNNNMPVCCFMAISVLYVLGMKQTTERVSFSLLLFV